MSIEKHASITLKSTFDKKFPFIDYVGQDVLIMAGQVTATKIVSHKTYDDSVALIGAFVVANLITGKQYETNMLYPPKDLGAQIHRQMQTDGLAILEFKAKIGLAPTDKTPYGYTWVQTPMLGNEERSRHDELKNSLGDMVKAYATALPAPKTDAKGKK
jgi:hypothetical protein